MTTPRIPDTLGSLTTGGLAAIGGAAPWIVVLILLPRLLGAVTRSFTEGLAGISTFRKESMWTRHEDRFLQGVDPVTGLHHIERVRRNAACPPTHTATDPTLTNPADDSPPSASPP
ncbi:hypothetical protein [Streptomyces sp. NPDC001530]|uniref:hypothetical protein n=1 Tax=Streptomyces sp. NPDC001530 TaxID=3364582 RepID=UPI0036CF0494